MSIDVTSAWQELAGDWFTWARTPGHDVAAWELNLPALAELLPDPGAASIDVGCGEGRVGRMLAERGHRVCGIDSSQLLADAAREEGGYQQVVCGDAAALPWPENTFDLAVAFMCLMDMPDAATAIREIARVLTPDGRLCLAIVHPFNQSQEARDDYFEEHTTDETVEHNGITMRFISRHRPLSHYTGALSAAGFVIEELREPRPPSDWPRRHPRIAEAYRRPFFLHMRARLLGP